MKMKTFQPKVKLKTVKDATLFKVEYANCANIPYTIESREFGSIKSMEQWIVRNDFFEYLILQRHALIDNEWTPFTVIGKRIITLPELKRIVKELENDAYKVSENKK